MYYTEMDMDGNSIFVEKDGGKKRKQLDIMFDKGGKYQNISEYDH